MPIKSLTKKYLEKLYVKDRKSVHEIATVLNCSDNKINYWLRKFEIKKRSISDALYSHHNPEGDPFMFSPPRTNHEHALFSLGIGLYWGEGNKKNTNTVRLGNTDPDLIKTFLKFLHKFYSVRVDKIRFGLQIFSDMNPREAQKFWMKELGAEESQFSKTVVTPARGIGNYREKTKHGVLTVYVFNKKLRDLICNEIEKLR